MMMNPREKADKAIRSGRMILSDRIGENWVKDGQQIYTTTIYELVDEIERLQKLAKRGHGKEFVEGNGRFEAEYMPKMTREEIAKAVAEATEARARWNGSPD